MDVPLAVRCKVVQYQRPVINPAITDVAGLARVQPGFVGRDVLAEVEVPLVIEVQRLPAGERTPGYQPLNVHAPGRVGAAVVGHAGPARAGENAPRLPCEVVERHGMSARRLGNIDEREADVLLFMME